jgi:hypothetical protein
MNGKGDKTRKKTVSQEVWGRNWELVFGRKNGKRNKSNSKPRRWNKI